MKHLKAFAMGIAMAAPWGQPVEAQVTLDVAKITCKQFRGYEITNPNNLAIWLSGYNHGKRGTTILQVDTFKDIVDKVNDYCISHPTMTVMQAAEAVMATNAQ